MVERDFPDGRMQKLMGKSWSSWNLPEQPTELDLRKLRDAYLPPDQYRVHHQSTPLPPRYMSLFGTHPDSDFLSITKCLACGWLMKVQHANKHFLRDSRGAIVCKDSDLAIFGDKVLGKACHPLGELTDTYSKKITLRALPSPHKSSHALRGTSSINEMLSKSRSGSGSHSSNKTDYFSHTSQYRSRSHSQMHVPSSAYMQKGRSGSSATLSSSSHSSVSLNSSNSSNSKGKSGKSHSSSSSSWSSLRSPPPPSKSSNSHKPSQTTSGSYTLSIPSDDMGQNESVEDILMSNISHSHGSSKHVHIIATSNSANKSKQPDPDYDHIKFYSDVPEKRLKLDSHSRNSDHHHKASSDIHHDIYVKAKQQLKHSSSSAFNGAGSSHVSTSESSKKSKSSSLSLSKNDSGSSNKHHLRSTGSSAIVTISKPVVAVSSMSSGGQSRSHTLANIGSSSISEKEKEKVKTSPQKKKKRKRDKDEPRKIIPLKDRDFNPDKHCGVCIQGTNVPCKRSLTCKTHSVASRRNVVGRSQPFDTLLAAHRLAAKSEEKVSQKTKDVVEEVIQVVPPKPKKKKLSGSTSTIASPNDLKPLAGVLEHTSYDRSGSPDIEVIEVKTKPKPMIPTHDLVYPKKYKHCPLVYPYTPDTQAKFESVWYNPSSMDRGLPITAEEKHKFVFLLKHYKNPFFVNVEVSQPLAKNVREKRNVFSNWNPSEKPVEGSQHTVSWSLDSRRQNAEIDDELQFLGVVNKK